MGLIPQQSWCELLGTEGPEQSQAPRACESSTRSVLGVPQVPTWLEKVPSSQLGQAALLVLPVLTLRGYGCFCPCSQPCCSSPCHHSLSLFPALVTTACPAQHLRNVPSFGPAIDLGTKGVQDFGCGSDTAKV